MKLNWKPVTSLLILSYVYYHFKVSRLVNGNGSLCSFLWLPYVTEQTIIFLPCDFDLLLFFLA